MTFHSRFTIIIVEFHENENGAKTAMRYAKRKGVRIINLYDEKDDPFYGMTSEEISAKLKEILNRS